LLLEICDLKLQGITLDRKNTKDLRKSLKSYGTDSIFLTCKDYTAYKITREGPV